jgi:hypothetical protein
MWWRDRVFVESHTLPQVERTHQGRKAGRDVDHCTSGEIERRNTTTQYGV